MARGIPIERPRWGIEPTFTNELFQEMSTEEQFDELMKMSIANAKLQGNDALDQALLRVAKSYPYQFDLFTSTMMKGKTAFPGSEGFIGLHKGLPNYVIEFKSGERIDFQFEWQAIEMHMPPKSIPEYEDRLPLLNRAFQFMKANGFHPSYHFGMGHLHQDMAFVPVDHPEIARNYLVSLLNDEKFWPLVGLNIQASILSEMPYQTRTKISEFLHSFDQWLRKFHQAKSRADFLALGEEIGKQIFPYQDRNAALELRDTLDESGQLELYFQIRTRDRLDLLFLGGDRLKSELGFILRRMVCEKLGIYAGAIHYDDKLDTLEFRRIPAQKDPEELILWMKLLEGRYKKMFENAQLELVPFRKTPEVVRPGYNEIEVFNRFILAGDQDPEEYRRFLPQRLKRVRVFYPPCPALLEQGQFSAPTSR